MAPLQLFRLLLIPAFLAASTPVNTGSWPVPEVAISRISKLTKADWASVSHRQEVAEYLSVLHPALEATRLAYTATHGTYRKPTDVNASLQYEPGWARVPALELDPTFGGLHALAFINMKKRKIVLAFRGTDMVFKESNPSGVADQCGDYLLWDSAKYPDWESLPELCRKLFPADPDRDRKSDPFGNKTLDYFAQAEAFVEGVRIHAAKLWPEGGSGFPANTLITGHSLGAGLAIAMGAKLAMDSQSTVVPAVLALSSPAGIKRVLISRLGITDLASLPVRHLTSIWNQYDPLYVQGRGTALPGLSTCTFLPDPEPESCKGCYQSRHQNPKSAACQLCFLATHVLGHYLHYLTAEETRAPLFVPSCRLPAAGAVQERVLYM
eukprot:TRINITY_DN33037_c0_g1_i1.p1 TRINITY_DN33037_c0_g1~~TRINITY_DN33037_c0_g1_i1.p1  ORF type:complete len:381 (-),score=29.05 TRINITY_DN33037_c0_g1_i1:223-1365(-)